MRVQALEDRPELPPHLLDVWACWGDLASGERVPWSAIMEWTRFYRIVDSERVVTLIRHIESEIHHGSN